MRVRVVRGSDHLKIIRRFSRLKVKYFLETLCSSLFLTRTVSCIKYCMILFCLFFTVVSKKQMIVFAWRSSVYCSKFKQDKNKILSWRFLSTKLCPDSDEYDIKIENGISPRGYKYLLISGNQMHVEVFGICDHFLTF